MLIGFIVVIVMILVIVGLMATGNSGGGTGVNQTKATKVVTEIGTLAQSLSFYKTTTGAGNFQGFTHDLGAVLLDGYKASSPALAVNIDLDNDFAATTPTGKTAVTVGVQSQAVNSLNYVFSTNASADKLLIHAILGAGDDALNKAIGTTIVSKLAGGNMSVNVNAVTGVVDADKDGDDDDGVFPATSFAAGDVITIVTR